MVVRGWNAIGMNEHITVQVVLSFGGGCLLVVPPVPPRVRLGVVAGVAHCRGSGATQCWPSVWGLVALAPHRTKLAALDGCWWVVVWVGWL